MLLSCRHVSIPLGLVLAALMAGCSHSYSVMLTASGEPLVDRFPEFKAAATESRIAEAAGLNLRVRFPANAEFAADEALDLVRSVAEFLQRETGATASGLVTVYLAHVPRGGEPPYAAARGPGAYTEILYAQPGAKLLEVDWNRDRFFGSFIHELAHLYLRGLPSMDRWLEDGLPEYLSAKFVHLHSEAAYLARVNWQPPLVALDSSSLVPWSYEDFERFQKEFPSDPELAYLVLWDNAHRYAAAGALVRRWMEAAEAKGIAAPVEDLLVRVRRLEGPVTLNDLETLVRQQTGQSLDDLARVSAEERAAEAERASRYLRASDPQVQIYALRTVEAFGLPADTVPGDLLEAVASRQDEYPNQSLYLAAGRAIASTGDKPTARRLVDLVRDRFPGDRARRYLPPQIWEALLPVNREEAFAELVAAVNDTGLSLPVRRDANESLERATGKSVGWDERQTAAVRARAAARWAEIASVSNNRTGEPDR